MNRFYPRRTNHPPYYQAIRGFRILIETIARSDVTRYQPILNDKCNGSVSNPQRTSQLGVDYTSRSRPGILSSMLDALTSMISTKAVEPKDLRLRLGRELFRISGVSSEVGTMLPYSLETMCAFHGIRVLENHVALACVHVNGKPAYLWFAPHYDGVTYEVRAFDPSTLNHGPDAGGVFTRAEQVALVEHLSKIFPIKVPGGVTEFTLASAPE